jgi:hypothetical protein
MFIGAEAREEGKGKRILEFGLHQLITGQEKSR